MTGEQHGAVPGAAHPPDAAVPVSIPGARARIRDHNVRRGRRLAVLDDDPTGSQSVHGVSVVTVLDPEEYARGLAEPGSTCFILTNTRSLAEPEAVALDTAVARDLVALERRLGAPVQLVSRGDSTLRGHVVAEVRALDAQRRASTGRGYDGVLLVPSYFEAGRFTAGDIHWAVVQGVPVPAGETEFARDATFGYTSSDLRDFVVEKGGGPTGRNQVRSISLDDIRLGGPDRVAAVLDGLVGCQFVVVNATQFADLEAVVLGLHLAEDGGKQFLHRSGPSFVRALAGIEPIDPLTAQQVRAGHAPARHGPARHGPSGSGPAGHGLVVVGSHVGQTAHQMAEVRRRGGVVEVELDVAELVQPHRRGAHVRETVERVVAGLAGSDVLLFTSRALVRGGDSDSSLEIARTVSTAVTEVVREALAAGPAWVIAKGGITSHDVAVRGLGIRRATVLGQVFPGMVSVLRPDEAPQAVIGMPYIVFAGNVGDENALADTIELLRG
ncbi:MAG: four-carbon acid sugar kinase family protein [Lapillicoccus sp.]